MTDINESRKKRRGRNALPDPRVHCVSVRLSNEELAILNTKRGRFDKGEWMRMAALDKLPANIPEPNQEKWLQLSKAASNLNQIARACNVSHGIPDEQFEPTRKALNDFRRSLLGVSE